MHVVLLKVLPLENEVALIKLIRLYTQKSISEIRQNLVSGLPVLTDVGAWFRPEFIFTEGLEGQS